MPYAPVTVIPCISPGRPRGIWQEVCQSESPSCLELSLSEYLHTPPRVILFFIFYIRIQCMCIYKYCVRVLCMGPLGCIRFPWVGSDSPGLQGGCGFTLTRANGKRWTWEIAENIACLILNYGFTPSTGEGSKNML